MDVLRNRTDYNIEAGFNIETKTTDKIKLT